ncbi:MAG: DUF2683 family protein [Candidatus Diapherotrites archaeon]|nr:DUF2683 family protein [Candidatus Diapherotrites archaeon]
MPIAIVQLSNEANHVINIVKAKYDLKDKSEAINALALEYAEEVLESELKPEYIEKLKIYQSEKTTKVTNLDKYFNELRRR